MKPFDLFAAIAIADRGIDAVGNLLKALVTFVILCVFGLYHYVRMIVPWIVLACAIGIILSIFDDPWVRTPDGVQWRTSRSACIDGTSIWSGRDWTSVPACYEFKRLEAIRLSSSR